MPEKSFYANTINHFVIMNTCFHNRAYLGKIDAL